MGNDYLFTRAFTDAKMADKILRGLSESQVMGLTTGATLLKSFELNASEAVMKLRECSETDM